MFCRVIYIEKFIIVCRKKNYILNVLNCFYYLGVIYVLMNKVVEF